MEELSKTESVLVGSIVKSSENLLSKLGLEIEFNDELKSIILQAFDESDDEIVYSAVKLLIGYEDKNIINLQFLKESSLIKKVPLKTL